MLATASALALAQALMVAAPKPAVAQTAWNGNTSTDWMVGSNWNGGSLPTGQTFINTNTRPTVLGVNGAETVSLSGVLRITGVADQTAVSTVGNLTIQSGSKLTTTEARIGQSGTGTVTITGTGSTWTTSQNVIVCEFVSCNATLTVSNGGSFVNARDFQIAGPSTASTGATGTLNVTSGGTISGTALSFGMRAGNTGNGTISGTNSKATISGAVTVGGVGNGTLTIDGGGTLEANSLTRGTGSGTASVTFNNATLRARAASTSFVTNFTAGQLTIDSGGLTIDTQTFAVTAAAPFGGAGVMTVTGGTGGTLTLSGANTFSGGLVVSGGTVVAGNASAFGSGPLTVATNATADLNNFSMTYAGLGGGGTVDLGTSTTSKLTLNPGVNTSTTFSGIIKGSGGLTKSGTGTVILSKDNAFTGATTISQGTLQLGAGGTAGMVGSDIANNGTLVFNRSDPSLTYGNVISGTGAVTKQGTGTLTLTGNNTYSGTTTISDGTLQVGNNGTSGSLGTGNVTNDSALVFNRSNEVSYSGVISGGGTLTKQGAGALKLTGNNTYSGTTTISQGTLQVGNNGTSGSLGTGNVTNHSALVFHRSNEVSYNGIISGSGTLTKQGAGALTLAGNNSYSGATTVSDGTLLVNGDQTAAGLTTVGTGATLGGRGTLGGAVTVNSGGTLLSQSDASDDNTLTIDGKLTLASGSNLDYVYGRSPNIDHDALMVAVNGDLDLNATLNISNTSGVDFESGIYGLIQYTGALGGSGLALGSSVPSGFFVQTAAAGRINLVNTNGLTLDFWDPTGTANDDQIQGGDGTWTAASGDIGWADGTGAINGAYSQDSFAVFQGTAGTVTVDNSDGAIGVSGMQFATDGYEIEQGTITLNGAATSIIVGDRTGSTVYTATIASELAGSAQLVKEDIGTLVLTGSNSYSGGTRIEDGTIQIARDANLGQTGTRLTFDGGTLQNMTTAFATARPVTIEAGGGTFQTDVNLTLNGIVGGAGALTKTGTGALTLTGNNTYSGTTTISDGTLQVGNNGTSGTLGTGNVTNEGTLVFHRSDATSYAGIISGAGSVAKEGAGTLTLSGNNTYSGTTTIAAGTLQVGNNGTSGTLGTGNITNEGTLVFHRSDATGYAGVISGSGKVTQQGPGTLTLTGNNTYSGTTTIAAGTLQIGNNGTSGTLGTGNVTNEGTLVFHRSDATRYSGVISGTGKLTKEGGGELTLSGANTFSGGLTVKDGTVTAESDKAFGAGVLTVDAGTADLNDKSMRLAGLAGTGGTVSLGAATLTLNQATTTSYAGVVTGTGELIKDGGGDLTLSGANTFDGGLTVKGGKVTADSDKAFGPGVLTVDAGTAHLDDNSMKLAGLAGSGGTVALGAATLTLDQAGTSAYQGTVSGTGRLVKDGAGTLTLNGTNSYSGGTLIKAGTLAVEADDNLGASSGGLTFDGGTLLVLNGFSSGRAVTLDAAGGTIHTNTQLILSGDISGAGDLTKIGADKLILTGNNSGYSGTTTITAGALHVGDGGTDGTLGTGDVVNDATLMFDRSNTVAYGGAISGTGKVTKDGGGTLVLTGTNSYAGETRIAAGTLKVGGGGTTGTLGAGDVVNDGTLAFDRSNNVIYPGIISGSGKLAQEGGGALTLSGDNRYAGTTTIAAGTLIIDGDQSAAKGATTVKSGGTLRGNGTIGGNVTVDGGGALAALDSAGSGTSTLTVKGDLKLETNAALNYDYGRSPNNDHDALLVEVAGDLHLNGTLNVKNSSGVSMDPGIYGLVHYDGALSGPGLALGTMPTSDFLLQTAVSGRVSIVNTAGLTFEYWDGGGTPNDNIVSGGSGVWQGSGGNHDWTTDDGKTNGPYSDNSFAAFQGVGGTVRVDNSQGAVRAAGMQFTADNYTLTGDAITLSGNRAGIVVGDNTENGAAYTTTITAVLQGGAQLAKDDLGTLVLSGTNTYSGGTALEGGTLSVRADGNLGASDGALTFDGGTLENTGAFSTARAVTLDTAGGTFKTDASLTLACAIGGAGKLTKTGGSTLTLTQNSSYTGGTTITAGTLQVGNGGTAGSLGSGNVVNDGALVFDRANNLGVGGAISGTGTLTKEGAGTLTLSGNNSYRGKTTIAAGTLQVGNGGTTGRLGTGDTVNNGALVFDRAGALTYAGIISGAGTVTKQGSGVTTLSGDNRYAGATTVAAGTLVVDGDQTAATGATSVKSGGTLRGEGTLGGDVTVDGGGALTALDSDDGISTLTIEGKLSLASGSALNYDYGVSPSDDRDVLLVDVKGDLDLNGTLNVKNSSGVDFDPGIYGLIHYGGALSDAGLTLGALPSSDFLVQTAVPGRVNLINTAGLNLEFWDGGGTPNDGVISGGSGVWQGPGGNHSWTTPDGTVNAPFADNGFAIFQGTGGTVTVDDGNGTVAVSGMQFAADGYSVTGDALTLADGRVSIVVGDRTENGTPYVATIESVLQGDAQLVKEDLGTLVLSAANIYTGGTAIDGGTLSVSSNGNLGAATGGLALDGGTLLNTGTFSTGRAVTLNTRGGTFKTDADLTLTGKIDGDGGLTKTGGSTLTLTGDNNYTGETAINEGTLSIAAAGNLGHSAALALNGGTLVNTGQTTLAQAVTLGTKGGTFATEAELTLAGRIGGDGALTKLGDDSLILTANNDYAGGTTVSDGTLQLGDGGTSGSIEGDVVNDGTLVFDRSDLLRLAGAMSGSGSVEQTGIGTTELSGKNSYTGATTVTAGRLMAGLANAFSAASDYAILADAVLDLGGHDQTLASLDNAGLVRFGSLPGTVLTVAGAYAGHDGTLMLNTELGDDDSRTDLLHVMGATSGGTLLAVTNIEGTGAHAVQGIKIVQVDGASDGTFTLVGDYLFEGDQAVVAGAYAYRLHKNGVSDEDGDWYLRSTMTQPAPNPPNPHYQPGAPVYEAYGQGLLALNAIGTLRARLGNRLWQDGQENVTTAATGPADGPASHAAATGLRPGAVWGRIEASHGAFTPSQATSNMEYDVDLWKLQTGLDAQLYETPAGQLVGGLFAQYGTVSTDVSSPHGHGKTDTTGYGLGGTLTWFGTGGLYVDGQAQAMWYDSDLASATAERDLARDNDGVGYALSLESGKAFTLTPNWSLTPQAQLVYSAIDFDAFTDTFGSRVALDTGDSLKGRAGLAADYRTTWRDQNGQAASARLFGTANLTYEMLDGIAIDLAGTGFATENDRLWGGVGLGGTYGWADNTYALHGELALDTSLENFADSYAVSGNVGLTMRW